MFNHIKVYIASKLRHAEKLKKFQRDEIHFNARWLDTGNLASNAAKPVTHWQAENFDDINSAKYVIVYAEEGEHLKGALIEVGYALHADKIVITVGNHPDYEPWAFYTQQVRRVATMERALDLILSFEKVIAKIS